MFAALKTAEQKMAESSDVNHVAKFLTYIARFANRHERIAQAEAEHAPERVVQWLKRRALTWRRVRSECSRKRWIAFSVATRLDRRSQVCGAT